MDYENNGAHPVRNKNSVFDCQKECQKRDDCSFFTFNTVNKNCWLKPFIGGKSVSNIAVSGPKDCPVHMSPSLEYCISTYAGNFVNNLNYSLRELVQFCSHWENVLLLFQYLFYRTAKPTFPQLLLPYQHNRPGGPRNEKFIFCILKLSSLYFWNFYLYAKMSYRKIIRDSSKAKVCIREVIKALLDLIWF